MGYLTEKDKKELEFLRKLAPSIKRQKCDIPLEIILDAIENNEAEIGSIRKKADFAKGKTGFLEREQGQKADGTRFYFSRTFIINNTPYYLDSLFKLEFDSAYSYENYK